MKQSNNDIDSYKESFFKTVTPEIFADILEECVVAALSRDYKATDIIIKLMSVFTQQDPSSTATEIVLKKTRNYLDAQKVA